MALATQKYRDPMDIKADSKLDLSLKDSKSQYKEIKVKSN